MEVKPSKFAEMATVTRQLLNYDIKKGIVITNAAGLIDTENPSNARYLKDRRQKSAKLAPAQLPKIPPEPPGEIETEAADSAPPAVPPLSTDAGIAAEAGVPEELLDLPLRELILRFGGLYGLERQAKILQQITAANDRYQRTQERGLKLIPKDFVQGTTIQFLKTLARQILEYPEGAVDDLIAKVQAHGADAKPEVILLLRNGLGRIIAGAKEEIIKDLELLKGKYSAEAAEAPAEND